LMCLIALIARSRGNHWCKSLLRVRRRSDGEGDREGSSQLCSGQLSKPKVYRVSSLLASSSIDNRSQQHVTLVMITLIRIVFVMYCRLAKVDLVRWSVKNLPLRDATVDIIVCDLPFGRRSGSYKVWGGDVVYLLVDNLIILLGDRIGSDRCWRGAGECQNLSQDDARV
jgi:hypothetical protein